MKRISTKTNKVVLPPKSLPSLLNSFVLYSSITLIAISFNSIAAPSTDELSKYLVIGTGSGEAFDSNGGELGANQEVTSSSADAANGVNGHQYDSYNGKGLSATQSLVSDARWVDTAEANNLKGGEVDRLTETEFENLKNNGNLGRDIKWVDYLKHAKPLIEAPDYSGNVAITADGGYAVTENTDYFASLGIQCKNGKNSDPAKCLQGDHNNDSWKEDDSASFANLTNGSGVSNFNPTDLLTELSEWQTFITSLAGDTTWAAYAATDPDVGVPNGGDSIENESYKDADGPVLTDLDLLDTNNDGYAVIDIHTNNNDFKINNSDWILKTDLNTIAIFRVLGGGNVDINNSSIMMGCPDDQQGNPVEACLDTPVHELGAIFYTDEADGNQAFDVENSILGGIGLWDFTNNNEINFNNVQGCTQLISDTVNLSSTNRLNRCALAATPPTDIPEPSTVFLLSSALLGILTVRKKQINFKK